MQYADAMYHVCLRISNNAADAEDLLQEAFMKVFDNIHTFRGASTIGAWIKQIVVNHCLNFVRKKKISFVEVELAAEPGEDDKEDEEEFEMNVSEVRHAIAQLPDGYRTVFNLYLFEEYSHKEIAGMLKISESTAKTQYFKAKNRIRELLNRKADGTER
jgi:RNA polymerase sigma-70 factor (ECF subfamily)